MFGFLKRKKVKVIAPNPYWRLLNAWTGRAKRERFGESCPMYWMYVSECGRFRISGLRDQSVLQGVLPKPVRELTDYQIIRYLLRHIPRNDRHGGRV